MEDDRGGLERRLMDRAEGMEQMGRYQSPLTGLLREATDAIGAARRALGEIDSALASYEAKLSESGCESWIDVDRIRMLIAATVARLEGGG